MLSTDQIEKIKIVNKNLSEPAVLEQMAEECSELTQALLKRARKLRNENYTPKTFDEIDYDLTEEFTDVILCAETLGLVPNFSMLDYKLDRWVDRLTRNSNEQTTTL